MFHLQSDFRTYDHIDTANDDVKISLHAVLIENSKHDLYHQRCGIYKKRKAFYILCRLPINFPDVCHYKEWNSFAMWVYAKDSRQGYDVFLSVTLSLLQNICVSLCDKEVWVKLLGISMINYYFQPILESYTD